MKSKVSAPVQYLVAMTVAIMAILVVCYNIAQTAPAQHVPNGRGFDQDVVGYWRPVEFDGRSFYSSYYEEAATISGEVKQELEAHGHDPNKLDRYQWHRSWDGTTRYCVAYHPGGSWHECWHYVPPIDATRTPCAITDGEPVCPAFDEAVEKLKERSTVFFDNNTIDIGSVGAIDAGIGK